MTGLHHLDRTNPDGLVGHLLLFFSEAVWALQTWAELFSSLVSESDLEIVSYRFVVIYPVSFLFTCLCVLLVGDGAHVSNGGPLSWTTSLRFVKPIELRLKDVSNIDNLHVFSFNSSWTRIHRVTWVPKISRICLMSAVHVHPSDRPWVLYRIIFYGRCRSLFLTRALIILATPWHLLMCYCCL